MHLHQAIIFVKDLERMAAFYADTLGLKPIPETKTKSWIEFEAGNAKVALHAIPPDIANQIQIQNPPQPRESNPIKLTFAVENLQQERKRLEGMGVTIIERP